MRSPHDSRWQASQTGLCYHLYTHLLEVTYMARKPLTESLGTYSEEKARRIAHLLSLGIRVSPDILAPKMAIPATVEELSVQSGPTVWWHVHVPARFAAHAMAWVEGYLAGEDDGRCGMRTALIGPGGYVTREGVLK